MPSRVSQRRSDALSDCSESVRVYCRVRPQNALEVENAGEPVMQFLSHEQIALLEKTTLYKFNYTRVFQPDTDQVEVYEEVMVPILDDVMSGINAAVMCYGQTSSGKTYTMEGDLNHPVRQGIVPRAMRDLFMRMAEAPAELTFDVFCSYIEIYQEKIYDLLAEVKEPLKARTDKSKGLFIPKAKQQKVNTFTQVFELLKTGARNREVAETSCV